MEGSTAEFQRLTTVILTRFYGQMSRPLPGAQIRQFAAQLGKLVEARALPRPLREDECGAPGGMTEEEFAPLIARVMEGLDDALLTNAAKQFVKACFYPEFKTCRDSFREVTREGSCRRQDLERVRSRISGTHCVDCPHWVALDPKEHAEYLAQEWRGDPRALVAHQDVFLPEDFRALRRWLYAAARRAAAP